MKLPNFRQLFCMLLITGLCLVSIPTPAKGETTKTNQEENSALHSQIITRVPDSSGGDLQHDTYQDASGKEYRLDTAADGNNAQGTADESKSDTQTKIGSLSKSLSKKQAVNLPSHYDLRTQNRTTSIKDQKTTGACWAFAAIKAAESNAITKGLATPLTADFSENHLTWFSFHASEQPNDPLLTDGFYPLSQQIDAAYDWGGSATTATFTLARWSGVVLESKAPFLSNQLTMAKKMSQSGEALRYQSAYHLQNSICYDNANQDTIKQVLMSKGALSLGLFYSSKFLNTGKAGTTYYQTAYADPDEAQSQSNHCVTIVGWDDEFSKTNFPSSNRPAADGAWLIANSYGTSVGDKGYFWLSYYDPSICDIYAFDVESSKNYDTNYQYDGFGWGSAVTDTNTNLTGANIFQAKAGYHQSLKAVGIYTITDKQPYTIKIYKNVKAGKPTSGTLVSASTTSGTAEYNGFHTITLKKAVALTSEQRFSVVVTYKPNPTDKTYFPLEGSGQTSSKVQAVYDSNPGESYFRNPQTGSWIDTSKADLNNVCIKAYAVNTAKAPVIQLSAKEVTLGKKEAYAIGAKFKNTTKKAVKYTSSKPRIAKVSAKGKITALRTGKTTITVKAGTARKTLVVTVKKAPSAITASVKRKVLKKGKTYRIKTSLSKGSASHKRTYSSSKPKVATVNSSGKVTARKKGKTTIRIKTYNKRIAKVTIQVK